MKLLSKASNINRKIVLVRVDFNVPIKGGEVANNERIKAAIPTIRFLKKRHCQVVLMSHLGRPKGKVIPELSLAPVAKELSRLLKEPVLMVNECVGAEVEEAVKKLNPGKVALLENTRFHPEEKANDRGFSRQLAQLADLFVFDGFAVAHREDASTTGVQEFLPSYAGLLVEKELCAIRSILESPKHPFVVVLGGAKLSDKLGVVSHMGEVADRVLIGGAMAFPILLSRGIQVGNSLIEEGSLELARQLQLEHLDLPVDFVVADTVDATSGRIVAFNRIPNNTKALDIGPATIQSFTKALASSKTVVWNGPMGVFENPAFSTGTKAVAEKVGIQGKRSLVGGGDTISAIKQLAPKARFTHVSTGGGALLTILAGKPLPALKN